MPSLTAKESEAAMDLYRPVVSRVEEPHRDERYIILPPFAAPMTDWLTGVVRDPNRVSPELAEAFKGCRNGQAPWPLMVHGSVGCGKTRFGYLCHDWYGGIFADFSKLLAEYVGVRRGTLRAEQSDILPTGGDWFVRDGYWIDALKRPRILILDDIGRRSDTEAATARELLSRLLDAREGMPSLLISNLAPSQLETVYDDRVASRMCAGTVVECVGQDRRIG